MIDQLTTCDAGHTDLAEIGNVGQSELLFTCELLGGRTLRISRDTGCDLLTREGSSRAALLLTDNCPTVCWFRLSCALWCPWRRRDSDVSDKTNQMLYSGRRLVRAALKLATQSRDTGCLFVWEWPRGCQGWELPEMKMFQTRCGNQLLYSDLDACVRDETTREWKFMTNGKRLHKILNNAYQARLVERNTLRHSPCQTLSSSGAPNSEDGAMTFGATRIATSYVHTSLDRGSRVFEGP